jgi:hypothetical protein
VFGKAVDVIHHRALAFMGKQHGEGLPQRVVFIIVEQRAGRAVHRADGAVIVENHHAIGRGFQDRAQFLGFDRQRIGLTGLGRTCRSRIGAGRSGSRCRDCGRTRLDRDKRQHQRMRIAPVDRTQPGRDLARSAIAPPDDQVAVFQIAALA